MENQNNFIEPEDMRNCVKKNGFKKLFQLIHEGETVDYNNIDTKRDFAYVVACMTTFDAAEFFNQLAVSEVEEVKQTVALFSPVIQQSLLDINLLFDVNIPMLEEKDGLTEDQIEEHNLIKEDFIRGTIIVAERILIILKVLIGIQITWDINDSLLNDIAELYVVATEIGVMPDEEEDIKTE